MDLAAEQIFLFSQGGRSLEEHAEDFSDLHHCVHYDEDGLCTWGWSGALSLLPRWIKCAKLWTLDNFGGVWREDYACFVMSLMFQPLAAPRQPESPFLNYLPVPRWPKCPFLDYLNVPHQPERSFLNYLNVLCWPRRTILNYLPVSHWPRRSFLSQPSSTTQNLQAPNATLACRPAGSTLAPRPTWDHSYYRSTGLPRPSGYTLVSCLHGLSGSLSATRPITPLASSDSTFSLASPWFSVALAPPQFSGTLASSRPCGFAFVSRTFCVDQSHLLFSLPGSTPSSVPPQSVVPQILPASSSLPRLALGLHPGLPAGDSALARPIIISALAPPSSARSCSVCILPAIRSFSSHPYCNHVWQSCGHVFTWSLHHMTFLHSLKDQ